MLAKLANHRGTTLAGGAATVFSLLVVLVPAEVRDKCFDTIQNSDNPIFVGTVAAVGIALLVIGPSLRSSANVDWTPPAGSSADVVVEKEGKKEDAKP